MKFEVFGPIEKEVNPSLGATTEQAFDILQGAGIEDGQIYRNLITEVNRFLLESNS